VDYEGPGEQVSVSLELLQQRLGLDFPDISLLLEALTHSSFRNEHGGKDNERMEFLGDSVLGLAITSLLYEQFPDADEGTLSRLRSRLVSTHTLAEVGEDLGIGQYLRLGVGEIASGGREKASILENTTEAVIGAIFLAFGYQTARDQIQGWMLPKVEGLIQEDSGKSGQWNDPRSRLQEWSQAHYKITPTYQVILQDGPPHAPIFTVEALLGERVVATATGPSKRAAIRAAAEHAWTNVHDPKLP
jgi:ribonuclease III